MNILPVFQTLFVDPVVAGFLGRKIYEDIAPKGTEFPYAVWSTTTALPEHSLDCSPQIDQIGFQLVVYDVDATRASDIRKAICKVLDPLCTVTSAHPNHYERIGDTDIFGRGFDANWWMDR
ncbi:DUF3168 domain-containing protein [Acinetobacter chinensis]|uniref:DUF3168 domain-containing protein n=1 Tax=Acinetobacter chinensis TaxID=2004650 RepID=A0A3B7LWK8_9GAMM|nr:DUF3168 domain-containing protein [Acinetobacter chinensis]AXY57270.1 DUF3168 domain-containing protein [Acinetobacter chinensis]